MDPEDSSGISSGSESTAKKRTRGIVKMGDLILARNQGRKLMRSSMRRMPHLEKSGEIDELCRICCSSLPLYSHPKLAMMFSRR